MTTINFLTCHWMLFTCAEHDKYEETENLSSNKASIEGLNSRFPYNDVLSLHTLWSIDDLWHV